jgi:hypothetical protein
MRESSGWKVAVGTPCGTKNSGIVPSIPNRLWEWSHRQPCDRCASITWRLRSSCRIVHGNLDGPRTDWLCPACYVPELDVCGGQGHPRRPAKGAWPFTLRAPQGRTQ